MYYLLLQAGTMLELTRMFDDGKSCETVVIFRLICKLGHDNCYNIDDTN